MPQFLHRRAPHNAKVIALRACANLFRENAVLPWHPNSQDIALRLLIPMRALLHQAVISAFGTNENGLPCLRPDQTTKLATHDAASDRIELLDALLQCWRVEPRFIYLHGRDSSDLRGSTDFSSLTALKLLSFNPNSPSHTLELLCCLLEENNGHSILQSVRSLLLECHKLVFETERTLDPFLYAPLSEISSPIAHTLGLALVSSYFQAYPDKTLEMTIVFQISDWLKLNLRMQFAPEDSPRLMDLLEICLSIGLLSLCSSVEKDRLAIGHVFRYLDRLADHIGSPISNCAGLANIMADESSPVVGGRLAQTKRLMKIFTGVTCGSSGIAMACDEAWRRWYAIARRFGFKTRDIMYDVISDIAMSLSQQEPFAEQDLVEWIHLSGFLTSTLHFMGKTTPTHLTSNFPADLLPTRFSQHFCEPEEAQLFLGDMIGLLSGELPRMRDAAKELLSNELSPIMLETFIEILFSRMDAFRQDVMLAGLSEPTVLLLDQTLAIAASLMVRSTGATMISAMSLSHFQDILLSAAHYLCTLDYTATVSRLSMKVCRAAEVFLDKYDMSSTGSISGVMADYLMAFLTDDKYVSVDAVFVAYN